MKNKLTFKQACENNLQVFTPPYAKKQRLFSKLKAVKATSFLLFLAGFKQYKIATLLKISRSTVIRYIKEGFHKYPNLKRHKN